MTRLTKKGLADRRFKNFEVKEFNFWQKYGVLVIAAIIGFLAGSIATVSIYQARNTQIVSLKPLGQTFELKPIEVKAQDWNDDLVGYFRHKGQLEGYNDYVITKLHGVMDCENGLHTADRKNYLYDGENGHYTAAGFAMITKGTFKEFKCSGDRFNGIDNINCFYKIYAKTGLKRYAASKSCWSKKFDVNSLK